MTRDVVHHRRRFGDTETRTAVFFGHRDTEPAAIGHRLVKRMRKNAVFVTREPVIVVEPGYDCANALANGVQFLHGRRRSYSVHHCCSNLSLGWGSASRFGSEGRGGWKEGVGRGGYR